MGVDAQTTRTFHSSSAVGLGVRLMLYTDVSNAQAEVSATEAEVDGGRRLDLSSYGCGSSPLVLGPLPQGSRGLQYEGLQWGPCIQIRVVVT